MKIVLLMGILVIVSVRGKVILDDKIIADKDETSADDGQVVSTSLDETEVDGKIQDLIRVPRQNPYYDGSHTVMVKNPTSRSLGLISKFLGDKEVAEPVIIPVPYPLQNPYPLPFHKKLGGGFFPHVIHPLNAPCPVQPYPFGLNLPQEILQKLLASSLGSNPSGLARSDERQIAWPYINTQDTSNVVYPYASSPLLVLDPSTMRADLPPMIMEHPHSPGMTSPPQLDTSGKIKRDSNLNSLEDMILNSLSTQI